MGTLTKQNVQYIQNTKQYTDISKHKHFNRNLFVLRLQDTLGTCFWRLTITRPPFI